MRSAHERIADPGAGDFGCCLECGENWPCETSLLRDVVAAAVVMRTYADECCCEEHERAAIRAFDAAIAALGRQTT